MASGLENHQFVKVCRQHIFQFAANEHHFHVLLTGIYDCGRVQDPENGRVNITGAERNATAEYYCTEGYRLVNGSPTRTCGEENQWTGIAPTCQGKFAADFNPPNKTYIHTDSDLASITSFYCHLASCFYAC